MRRQTIAVFLVGAALLTGTAAARQDAYHTALRAALLQDYGIGGGDWVFSDTEAATLALGEPSNGVTPQSVVPTGQPFTRASRYIVSQPGDFPWDRTVRFLNQAPIARGDALLLVMWLRHQWPAGNLAIVGPVFEQAGTPYEKSLEEGHTFDHGEWTRFLIPFEAVHDYAIGGGRFQLNMGFDRQMIELGGLALINYGRSLDVGDLPRVEPPSTYPGRDAGAPWRAEAQVRIDQYRKGSLRIEVTDADGQPVPGATVRARMTRHKFGFGTAVAVGRMVEGGRSQRYLDTLEDLTGDGRTFNMVVLENALKWDAWEGNWPASKAGKVQAIEWLRDRNMDIRGHNMVWPGWQYLPDDLETNQGNASYLSDRIAARISEIGSHTALNGVLRDWDVINEPVHNTALADALVAGGLGASAQEVFADWFLQAKAADAHARLFINEYSIVSSHGQQTQSRTEYRRLIQDLLDHGAPVEGVGIQGHMGVPFAPPDTVVAVMDYFAGFGLPISITEYDTQGVQDDLAADYLRDFLTAAFSHPSVESFLMWGFWDGAHWGGDAPLFEEDWTLKPAGQAFLDLVFDEWWTDEELTTGADGVAELRGFLGTYRVEALVDGRLLVQEMELSDPSGGSTTIIATGVGATDTLPDRLVLGGAWPNPAGSTVSVGFVLPEASAVWVDVFDITGRLVTQTPRRPLPAGESVVSVATASLAPGIYWYRVHAGERTAHGALSVLH